MTPEEYTVKFYNEESNKFNHEAFIKEFRKEFLEILETREDPYNYIEFNNKVTDMYQKFKDILAVKDRKGYISYKLWKFFFATVVVPIRGDLFPEVQAEIDMKKKSKHEEG